jgi:hypothetical protein
MPLVPRHETLDLKTQTLTLVQQVWFLPFVWSLTAYLYWAFRDILIFHKSLMQLNALNSLGICVSLGILLAKSPIETKVRQVIASLKKPVPSTITQTFGVNGESSFVTNAERKLQTALNLETPTLKPEIFKTESISFTQKRVKSRRPLKNQAKFNHETTECPKSKCASDDCFVCPELVTCAHRIADAT